MIIEAMEAAAMIVVMIDIRIVAIGVIIIDGMMIDSIDHKVVVVAEEEVAVVMIMVVAVVDVIMVVIIVMIVIEMVVVVVVAVVVDAILVAVVVIIEVEVNGIFGLATATIVQKIVAVAMNGRRLNIHLATITIMMIIRMVNQAVQVIK